MGSYDLQPLQSFTETHFSDNFLSCFPLAVQEGNFHCSRDHHHHHTHQHKQLRWEPEAHGSCTITTARGKSFFHQVKSSMAVTAAQYHPYSQPNFQAILCNIKPPWKMDSQALYSRQLEVSNKIQRRDMFNHQCKVSCHLDRRTVKIETEEERCISFVTG